MEDDLNRRTENFANDELARQKLDSSGLRAQKLRRKFQMNLLVKKSRVEEPELLHRFLC